jgi:hypothetical protein
MRPPPGIIEITMPGTLARRSTCTMNTTNPTRVDRHAW